MQGAFLLEHEVLAVIARGETKPRAAGREDKDHVWSNRKITYFPRFWEACRGIFSELSPTTHHPNLDIARLSACTRQRGPREAALQARRRAQPARRRREVLAQLRRRSRVGFAPCDPVPALRSSVVEAAAPRSS